MPYAPVKSNPYSAGKARKRRAFRLWPETAWKEMTDIAGGKRSGCVLEVIRRWNIALYGKP